MALAATRLLMSMSSVEAAVATAVMRGPASTRAVTPTFDDGTPRAVPAIIRHDQARGIRLAGLDLVLGL